MKKLVAMLLAVVLVFSLAACSGSKDNTPNNGGEGSVDLSAYPSDINDWSAQNLIDYFTEAGVFTEASDRESWLQDHPMYWSGTPFNECAGYWDDAGEILIMCWTFDETLSDTTPEEVQAMKDYIIENHALTDEYMSMPVDHLVGNVAFSFTFTSDDDVYNAAEEAYTQLINGLGATPEF